MLRLVRRGQSDTRAGCRRPEPLPALRRWSPVPVEPHACAQNCVPTQASRHPNPVNVPRPQPVALRSVAGKNHPGKTWNDGQLHRGDDAVCTVADNPEIVGTVANNHVVRCLVSFELDGLTIGTELIIRQQRGDGLNIVATRPFQPVGPARHAQQSPNRGPRVCLQTGHQQVKPSADVGSSLTVSG